jgi:DNA-3-methyladenine glycosylase I
VLNKREAFREAFAGFDPVRVATFNQADIDRLMQNASIIRARAKIEATITGARIYCEMKDSGEDFSDYCWAFTQHQVLLGDGKTLPVMTVLSEEISKSLKRKGIKFVCPTIVYA